jgi:DNA primase
LEECFTENVFTIRDILNRCDDEKLIQFITGSISDGVYQSEKVSAIVNDTVNYIKRNKLDAQRNKLLQRIREYTVVTQEDQNQLNALLAEKLELDKQVQSLGKK